MDRLRGRNVGAEIFISHTLKEATLLQSLTNAGLLGMRYDRKTTDLVVRTTSSESARFLNTDAWLIAYVWQELQNANFADDCQANIQLQSGQVRLEIDLALVYRSRLLIAECCAPRSVLGLSNYLERLDATAHLVGGEGVSKVLIINLPSAMHSDSNRYYDAFWEKAKQLKTAVVTKEDLPNIAAILKREMTTPNYARV